MSGTLNPNCKYKTVKVNCSSFLTNMEEKLGNMRVGFSMLGGKNPFELTDERAFDMYAITHIVIDETHTTDDGFDMSMQQYLSFSEGLETYFDTNIFHSVKKFIPAAPENAKWQLQQISLSDIDPNHKPDIATNDADLIPIFSGQLTAFGDALRTIISKKPDESFCLLYALVSD